MRPQTIFLIFCAFSLTSFAQAQTLAPWASEATISAPLEHPIAHYQKRWFWEPLDHVQHYVGLFSIKNSKPEMRFVKTVPTASQHTTPLNTRPYLNFLKNKNLLLKIPPLKGWSYVQTGNSGHHLFENMYGDFAWDFSKQQNQSTFRKHGTHNHDHYVWGEPVYSPVSGTLVDVYKKAEDNLSDPSLTGDLSQKGDGNYVLIHLYDHFYLSILHFKKGSIPSHWTLGSKVQVGDFLGLVGNSGISYTPHLHMSMYYWSADLKRMVSVPSFFERLLLKTSTSPRTFVKKDYSPKTGQSVRAH